MKNFFKKLAFVLALAMVVTAIAPAAKASAATEPTFKYSGKVLYIGGDKTGSYGDTYRFTFNNAKGYTATWKSSKASVATIDAKTGKIQAVAVGKTVITATLTKGKTTVECTANVTVKQNADKIGFGSTAAVKNLAVGDTGKVNVYRQVGTTKVWKQADKTVTTDVVKWTTSDASVATVDKWGKVTAVAAGEATITATATQSEGSTAVVAKSYKVTIAAGLVDAKQAGLSTITAKFAGDLSAVVTKADVTVSQIVGTSKVNVVVKDLAFDATDKTKATITVYTTFAKDAEYVVEYKDTKASFKGADTSADAVDHIAIKTTEVKPGEATAIEFYVYDKNGIDITTSDLTNRISVKLVGTNADCFVDESSKTIVFWVKDKSATIKASYNTYTYNADYTPKTIDVEGVIVSKENVTTLAGLGTATISNGDPDFTKPVTSMSVKDSGYKLYIKTVDNNNNEVTNKTDSTVFALESSDNTILMIAGDNTIMPIKEGTAQILVKYNDVLIGAVTVTIGAERKPATVTATFDRTTLSMGSTANDKITLTVEAKDQYGAAISTKAAVVTFLTGAKTMTDLGSFTLVDGKKDIDFAGSSYDTKGSYQYKVKVGDVERYVSFTVGNSESKTSTYALTNANKAVDTALKIDGTETATKEFEVSLYGVASNGFKTMDIPTFDNFANALNSVKNTTSAAFYYEVVDKDGNVVTDFDANQFIDFATSSASGEKAIVVKPVVASGSTLIKIPTGTYQVKAVKVDLAKCTTFPVVSTDTKIVKTTVAITSFVVTDTQAAPSSVSIKKTEGVSSVATFLATTDYIEIKFNDNTVALTAGDVVNADKKHFIKTVKVSHTVDYAGDTSATTYEQEITINTSITE